MDLLRFTNCCDELNDFLTRLNSKNYHEENPDEPTQIFVSDGNCTDAIQVDRHTIRFGEKFVDDIPDLDLNFCPFCGKKKDVQFYKKDFDIYLDMTDIKYWKFVSFIGNHSEKKLILQNFFTRENLYTISITTPTDDIDEAEYRIKYKDILTNLILQEMCLREFLDHNNQITDLGRCYPELLNKFHLEEI
jgi:hypothetical protein